MSETRIMEDTVDGSVIYVTQLTGPNGRSDVEILIMDEGRGGLARMDIGGLNHLLLLLTAAKRRQLQHL